MMFFVAFSAVWLIYIVLNTSSLFLCFWHYNISSISSNALYFRLWVLSVDTRCITSCFVPTILSIPYYPPPSGSKETYRSLCVHEMHSIPFFILFYFRWKFIMALQLRSEIALEINQKKKKKWILWKGTRFLIFEDDDIWTFELLSVRPSLPLTFMLPQF